eukprot:TRINITY_DN4861_c0_g1_i2.p1 TRINITY_DN4861_c0_g1~~TRINITY_DN4861_c0_g1_i2.p1  ORF type:complete len:120 (-),score=2.71 TRINITY_DN4861_c0_g1_i2:46-405(-)
MTTQGDSVCSCVINYFENYPLLGSSCRSCNKHLSDQHHILCMECATARGLCNLCGKRNSESVESVPLQAEVIVSHQVSIDQKTTNFWKSHCPATMGGKCSFRKGKCRNCQRDENEVQND